LNNELLLIVSAFMAGAINAVAGGGTFFTFPALLMAGIPPISANATSTIAVFPGQFSGAYAYREDFKHIESIPLWAVVITSLIGGWSGSAILLATPQQIFVDLIPWLLLLATVLFAIGKSIGQYIAKRVKIGLVPTVILLLIFAVYGGYFGAGVGIITLALLSVLGLTDLNEMNAIKTIANGTTNVAAVFIFIAKGAIVWHPALIMAISAIVGGYLGARIARKVDQRIMRWLIVALGLALSAYYFVKKA
jgi:uncharacterized membrane protein YfcA